MSIFSYPVELTVEDLKNERGLDLIAEYGSNGAKGFLADVHASVYEGCIYATGDRKIKDKIIKDYGEDTRSAIKRALIFQAAYMHDEGNVATANGITITADGQKAVITRSELRSKVLCIAAFDALKGCACPILYAGERV